MTGAPILQPAVPAREANPGRRFRPLQRPDAVRRTRLLRRLAKERACPVVLLVAPAGYGKSTLLAQWSEHDVRPFAWLTLDDRDDAATLKRRLIGAVDKARRAAPGSRGFVLVLDRGDSVEPGVLGDVVLDLLEDLPVDAQIAIASRSAPALPTASMRSHGLLAEFGTTDLAMSTPEAASLFRRAGLELDLGSVRTLASRTEGWPAALQHAARSAAARADPIHGAARFAGDDHLLAEYIHSEILSDLSRPLLRFLTRSAILDRLSAAACDAVLQRSDSARVLAELARANVPMRAVDASHEFFRVHVLMREMLQTELRRGDPDLLAELHGRAADYYEGTGDADRAIQHARDGGDDERAGALLWEHLPEFLADGRDAAVNGWLQTLPAWQTSGGPELALARAHHHLVFGDIAAAEHAARSAQAALAEAAGPAIDEDRAAALIVHAWTGHKGAAGMGRQAARAGELVRADSAWGASCCLLRGTALLLTGDGAAATGHLQEGAARGALIAPHVAALCLAQLAVIAADAGEPDAAADAAMRAQSTLEQHAHEPYPTAALVPAVVAATSVHHGGVDAAKAATLQCEAMLADLDGFADWYGAETRIFLARGLLALGDVTAARERLAQASRLARRTSGMTIFTSWFDGAWEQFDQRAESALAGVATLTTAELRVLRFLPTHYSFHEIADRLHVSSNTVKTHVHAVYRKLDATSRSEAVANATGAGLLGC